MLLLYVCLLAVGHVSFAKTLLKDAPLPTCSRSDPELNSCLLTQVGPAIKVLKKGSPELGLEPMYPFKLDFMAAEGDLEFIKIKMVMKNISLTDHLEGITFSKIKFDPISLTGDISLNVPYARMICDYFATGRLFVLPLENSAHFDGNFTNIDLKLSFRLNTVQKKGKEYFTVDKMTTKMHVGTGRIKLISIDPANQQQVNVIQDFYNENDRLVLDTVNPILNEYDDELFKHYAESYIRRIPAEELLSK